MKRIFYILCISVLLFTNCTTTQLVAHWKNPEIDIYEPQKVLVIGLTSNAEARLQFEKKLVEELEARGSEAVMSLTMFKTLMQKGKLTEDELLAIENTLIENGFDTIILTKVVGVEVQGSACLHAAMQAGRRVKLPLETLDLFADGVSVAQVGKENFKVAKKYVDAVVVCNIDEICAAIKDVFEETRVIAEPAGALAVAGMKRYLTEHPASDQSVVAIVSGANVNFDRLRHISERSEIGEQREAILAVTIDEVKGSFLKFCRALGKRSITEFNYRWARDSKAHIYVGMQVSTPAERDDAVAGLSGRGYAVVDMTNNEAAKLHVRHMVGGRSIGGRGSGFAHAE